MYIKSLRMVASVVAFGYKGFRRKVLLHIKNNTYKKVHSCFKGSIFRYYHPMHNSFAYVYCTPLSIKKAANTERRGSQVERTSIHPISCAMKVLRCATPFTRPPPWGAYNKFLIWLLIESAAGVSHHTPTPINKK